MRIWAISDLHLSFGKPKPMDLFGDHWRDHAARIARAWRERVAPEDVVCLPGDLSWALKPAEAQPDLAWLAGLPGRKVLVKGNHDYWWTSTSRVRRMLPEGAVAIQGDAVEIDGVGFAGARGWVDPTLDFAPLSDHLPGEPAAMHGIRGEAEDRRIYERELGRLERSLRALGPGPALRVALLHFPPTSPRLEDTPVTRLLERHGVEVCAFGHLHGPGWERYENPYGEKNGVRYYLVSADFARFAPVEIWTLGR
ncbi:metallophosphoesterase [Deferrisoma sp.]